MALGMDWLIRLPEKSDKQRELKKQAIELVAIAADRACEALNAD